MRNESTFIMNSEYIIYTFDISWFSQLPSVLIGLYYCFKVERCNYTDYIMRCLSITTHCYACENCLVNQMLTLIMTCLRTSLMSNGLVRGNVCLILDVVIFPR